jgi:hypothetical protein
MSDETITYRLHAVQRMFERIISAKEVRYIPETGEVIEDCPDDTPDPSEWDPECRKRINEMRYLQKSINEAWQNYSYF